MMYSVDKIENGIATIENLLTKELINVKLKDLPNNVKEKDMLMYDGNSYMLDESLKEKRTRMLKDKMELLRKKEK